MAKFTIEQVLENIKGKFTNAEGKSSLQISDRTVTETLAPLLSLVGEEMEVVDFVEKYGFPAIDSANRNLIKLNSDFAKNYKPTPPDPPKPPTPPAPFDLDAFFEKMAETQKKSLADAIAPLNSEIEMLKKQKGLNERAAAVAAKKAEMKLSKNWAVDFDNSVERAELVLGEGATADEIYNNALEHFNKTLTNRGEKYEPKEGSGGSGASDFSDIIDIMKKEQNQQ